ncbi:U3 small nucleolar RNA-associated protein 14 homolog A [Ixodes scapularis]
MAASTYLELLRKRGHKLQDEFVNVCQDKGKKDDDGDDFRHTKLLDAIGSLGGKKKVTPRTEPSLNVSEYDLSQAEKEKVAVHQLLMNLKQTEKHRQLRRQVRAISRNAKVLPTPLPKPQQHRVERQVAYDKVEGEVSRWDPVVKKNRLAEQICFPLQQPDMRMVPAEQFVKKFQPKTSLEAEINKLLASSENVLHDDKELTPAEEKALQAMSLDEARERRQELMKMRALLSYQEMKARRQNKIKSKKYHRIMKKERLKKQMKEFEELKESNPELAIEKLRELEKQRVLERVSLRHKSTGKWAKQQMLRSKYNQESREALLKQLEMSRQLTHKAAAEESSESDDDPSAAAEAVAKNGGELEARFFSSSNPWLKNPALGITNKTDADDEPALDSESENGGDESIVEGVSSNGGEPTLPLLERKREETNAAVSGADIDQGTSDFMVPEEAKNSSNEAVTGSSGASKEESFSDPNKKSHSPDKSSLPGTSRAADKVERRKKKKVSDRAADIEELFDTFSRRKQKKKESLLKKRGFEVESSTERKTAKDLTSRKDSVAAEGPSEQLDEGLERRQTLADLEAFEKENTPKQKKTRVARDEPSKKTPVVSDKVEVDPTKFLQVKQTSLKSQVPDLQGAADEALDDEEGEEEQAVTIAEAFADDDVISAFREEKKAQVKRDAPEVIDNYLPGWGSWGGTGIKVNKKKRRRSNQQLRCWTQVRPVGAGDAPVESAMARDLELCRQTAFRPRSRYVGMPSGVRGQACNGYGAKVCNRSLPVTSNATAEQARKMRLILPFVKCEISLDDSDDVLRERGSDYDGTDITSADES